jgi:hypothetical protein
VAARSCVPHRLALALALAAALPAQAARFTWHGDLLDGDAPADGRYDLRLRTFAQPGAKAPLGEATELPGVRVVEGRFSVELELPEDPDGTTWVEIAVRDAADGGDYATLGAPQPLTKVNSTCPGAWALDGNSGTPAGSYLGHADARTLFLRSSRGIAVNSTTELTDSATDLLLRPKSGGDTDADLVLETSSGKSAEIYLRESNGNLVLGSSGAMEFFDDIEPATQNAGGEMFSFSGRLRSRAVGTQATDTSGGLWVDDERPHAAYLGRGDNASNWTGIYESTRGWLLTAHDNGAIGLNTGLEALPANVTRINAPSGAALNGLPAPSAAGVNELTLHPAIPGTEISLVLYQNSGQGSTLEQLASGTMRLTASSGDIVFRTPTAGRSVYTSGSFGAGRDPLANALEVEGAASKTTAGDWLANSDRRIKTQIAPVQDAIDTILRLRPVTFRYGEDYRRAHPGLDERRYYNVLAQEFAQVFPEAVRGSGEYLPGLPRTPGNEILQVDTYPAQVTALAAIQELARQDEALHTALTRLEAENRALRADLQRLRQRLDDDAP